MRRSCGRMRGAAAAPTMSRYGLSSRTPPGWPLIALTFFLALTLEFLPWPGWALGAKPLFPDLALVYWVVHRPQIVNYAAGIFMGLMMDLAGQLPMGCTALSYTLMVMLANGMRGRFSLLGPVGQAAHVLFVLGCGQAALFLLRLLEGGDFSSFGWGLFLPSASAAALWLMLPLLFGRLAALLSRRRDD